MKQIGLAVLNFEAAHKKLPTGGEGNGAGTASGLTAFSDHSVLVYLLPYLEQQEVYDHVNLGHYYRMADNINACARNIPTFVCPSNPFVNFKDTDGLDTVMDTDPQYGGSASTTSLKAAGRYWGTTDYFATVYTSISDGSNAAGTLTGLDDKRTIAPTALWRSTIPPSVSVRLPLIRKKPASSRRRRACRFRPLWTVRATRFASSRTPAG